uniref:Uncharacterized protein n=1 Tax=Arundo donax TaxID=35708 RepID=A0A0A8ZII9_ARUDO
MTPCFSCNRTHVLSKFHIIFFKATRK